MARKRQKPRCIVIAGPNGAGKTTFARDYLPAIAAHPLRQRRPDRWRHFAPTSGTGRCHRRSPGAARTRPSLVKKKADFAFESTLSGLLYAKRIQNWKAQDSSVAIAYLRLASPNSRSVGSLPESNKVAIVSPALTFCVGISAAGLTSLKSIAPWRIIGPSTTILNHRRNGWNVDHGPRRKKARKPESFSAGVGRGLRLAEKTARKVARMHGTPVYFWKNGKVVAEKP